MSLLVAEGFDQYGTDVTLITDGGKIIQYDVSNASIVAGGICGTNAFQDASTGPNGFVVAPGHASQFSWGHVDFNFNNIGLGDEIITFRGEFGEKQSFFAISASGSLQFWQGPTFTTKLVESATGLINNNTWTTIEWEVTIDASAGTVQAWIDGLEAIPLTVGLNTKAGAFGTPKDYSSVKFGGPNRYQLDNLVMGDDVVSGVTGKPNDGRIGRVHLTYVEAELDSVAGGGNYKQWTPLSGTDHGAMVDESPHDSDTTYNFSAAPTLLDSYTVPNIKITSGDIFGISIIPWVKKSDALNARLIRPFYRLSGADTFGAAVAVPDTQYEQKPTIFEGNGAAAWTVANVNALEIGVEDNT